MTLGEVVSIYYRNLRGVDTGVFYCDEETNDKLCEIYLDNALRLIRTATGELCEDERYKRGWLVAPYLGCVATLNDINLFAWKFRCFPNYLPNT